MKRALLLMASVVLVSCQTARDYYDLWFVVPKPPPLEGARLWRE